MKNAYYMLAALTACCINVSALAAVTASVNRNNPAMGENIQLRIQRDSSTDTQPDISPLKKDFDILGSSRGSNVQIINGHMSTQTQITILLSPRHDGKIQVPPLQWDGEKSAAIELVVGGGAGSGSGSGSGSQNTPAATDNSHVFITTSLDQKQTYVQAAAVLTVRLYTDQSLLQASLDFPSSSDILVKQLGKDVESSEVRNGRNYQIVERKYLLFPQRSGKLSLSGPVLDAQVQDNNAQNPFDNIFRQIPFGGMLNATRPIRVHAKAIELNILPRPAAASGSSWLPAQKVTLEEIGDAWQQNTATVRAGEPITRQLQITALGLTSAQLPDPHSLLSAPEGIKAYPDQPVTGDKSQGNTVLGNRSQNIALIASRPGRYELPAVRLSWWDLQRNEKRELSLPARTLEVLPAAAGTTPGTTPPPGLAPSAQVIAGANQDTKTMTNMLAGNQPWMWLSLVLALLWLVTLAAWWRARQRRQPEAAKTIAVDKKNDTIQGEIAFKAFNHACSNNDAHAARKHLLAWAPTAWPAAPPTGLNELSRRYEDAKLAGELRQLDRACFTGSAWNGGGLAKILPKPPLALKKTKDAHSLPELYT